MAVKFFMLSFYYLVCLISVNPNYALDLALKFLSSGYVESSKIFEWRRITFMKLRDKLCYF